MHFTKQERLRFKILGVMLMISIVYCGATPLFKPWKDIHNGFLFNGAMLGIAILARLLERAPRSASVLVAFSQLGFFALFGIAVSPAAIALAADRPLLDPLLYRLDQAIGFDWLTVYTVLKAGSMTEAMTIIYVSHVFVVPLTVIVLMATRQERENDVFLLAFFIAILFVIAFSALFPSFGGLPHLVANGAELPPISAILDVAYAQLLHDVKDGLIDTMVFNGFKGFVGFPSGHAVFGVIVAYALRNTACGPAALAWGMLTLISAPVDGGHHLMDVIGGVVVTLAAIRMAEQIIADPARLPSAKMFPATANSYRLLPVSTIPRAVQMFRVPVFGAK